MVIDSTSKVQQLNFKKQRLNLKILAHYSNSMLKLNIQLHTQTQK